MKILAIESSGMRASVAVAEDGMLLGEYTAVCSRRHCQTLLPMMDQICSILAINLRTIDAVAVSGGPGSFTGLRIGSATAKGIAFALNRLIVNVPTLEGMAYNLFGCESLVVPMIDARGEQVFAGIYSFRVDPERTGADHNLDRGGAAQGSPDRGGAAQGSPDRGGAAQGSPDRCGAAKGSPDRGGAAQGSPDRGGAAKGISSEDLFQWEYPFSLISDPLEVMMDQTPVSVQDICVKLNDICPRFGKRAVLLGDGASVYRDLFERNLIAAHRYVPDNLNAQCASSVAMRAFELLRQGRTETSYGHRPNYLRVSQAERVRFLGRSK